MNAVLSFNEVSKNYGRIRALRSASFDVAENSCTGLVGNNGSGKTTSINILCNLIPYDKGAAIYKGKKITPDFVSYKNEIGAVLSTPYYIEELTVNEYLKFVCRFRKIGNEEAKKRISDLINYFGLEGEASRPVSELSSGGKMKVSFLSCLVHNPSTLLLDEPFVNLDVQTTENIAGLLKSMTGRKTIFITSHNLPVITELCDNFIIIDKGSIAAAFSKSDMQDDRAVIDKIKSMLVTSVTDMAGWLK